MISCLDYNEKMKLNDDGSGEITFAVGLSEGLFNIGGGDTKVEDFNEDKIKSDFENKDGIKVVDSRSYTKDGNRWIEVTLNFESLEKLQQATKDSSTNGMIGKLSLTENSKGNWVFTRTIFGEKKNSDNDSNGMMAMMFSKYKWHYELTLPSHVISTNANENDIDRSTNTIKWTFSLASLADSKLMTVTFEKLKSTDFTDYIYMLVGAVLLVVLSIAAINMSKKKKNVTA